MDVAALEQRLRDAPDDVASWQVYADWLLDHGDERGGAIHAGRVDEKVPGEVSEVTVRVAASRYGFPTKLVARYPEDVAIIDDALAQPEHRFVTGLRWIVAKPEDGDSEEDDSFEFGDDGQPVPLPPIEIDGLADLTLAPIRSLDLSYMRIGAAGATIVSRFTGIEELDLRYAQIGDDGVKALLAMPALRRVHLQRNRLTSAVPLQKFDYADYRYNDVGTVPWTSTLPGIWRKP